MSGMSILHHTLRTIWANLFGLFTAIGYGFKFIFSKKARKNYKDNKSNWKNIRDMIDLKNFIKNIYIYKYDGPKGIFDHNNFGIEWYQKFGDCDDVANWVCKKIKELFPKEKIEYCAVYGFADLKALFWHYDVIYKFKENNSYHLFNYGKMNSLEKIEDAGKTMTNIYSSMYPNIKNMKVWKCNWM